LLEIEAAENGVRKTGGVSTAILSQRGKNTSYKPEVSHKARLGGLCNRFTFTLL
jgi:hypothetical protein